LVLIRSNVPTVLSVKPYTPLELVGRDIYVAEGCYNCHSQMVRPMWAETKRYGAYSRAGENVYDHPFQWGSRRIGPDLAREGGKQSVDWHVRHFEAPRSLVAQSIMPGYAHLLRDRIEFESVPARVRSMAMLGVPYGPAVDDKLARELAQKQALTYAQQLEQQSAGKYLAKDMADKKVIALVAYLQRIGTDLTQAEDWNPYAAFWPTDPTKANVPAPAPAPAAQQTTAPEAGKKVSRATTGGDR
jgi:cytochrome c oxidase cbb3-type subunit I/II